MKEESTKYKKLHVYTDGGSRGNPGPSAIGVYITDEKGSVLYGLGKCIGVTTNNVAEYTAILEACRWMRAHKDRLEKNASIDFFLDSELAYSQLVGIYKIKNTALRAIFFEIRIEEGKIACPIRYSHILREKNKEADKLVNRALDNPPQVTYN